MQESIVAWGNTGEVVISINIGQNTTNHRLASISQAIRVHVLHKINGNIGQTGFASIICAIAIGIVPYRTANRRI